MRQTLLSLAILGTVLASSAGARILGWHGGGSCASFGPPVVASPYPYPYAYPYYAAPVYQPYVYGPSYFRPDVPYGSNAQRNWRDTWEDDGVKVHSYTIR